MVSCIQKRRAFIQALIFSWIVVASLGSHLSASERRSCSRRNGCCCWIINNSKPNTRQQQQQHRRRRLVIPPGFGTIQQRRGVLATSTPSRKRERSTSGSLSLLFPSTCGSRLLMSPFQDNAFLESPIPVGVVAIAGALLFLMAQGWINNMLEGDQGLGAFLSDGSGYSNSGFRPVKPKTTTAENKGNDDPLPWLKLPQLDFVDVAGQEKNIAPAEQQQQVLSMEKLETLRRQMNDKLSAGQYSEATALREELENLMKENGIEYDAD